MIAASFGVAVYPQHGTNIADFVKAADRALYAAKETGRDRVCRAEEPAATSAGASNAVWGRP